MPTLTLIRGLPGSGKSTLARELQKQSGAVIYEADMYHCNEHGDYIYDKANDRKAHEWCEQMTKEALEAGDDVIVANTFVKKEWMEPYEAMGFPIVVMVARGTWKSVHGVPEEIMERYRATWEE